MNETLEFNVKIHVEGGVESFACKDDEYILDAAEDAGIPLAYSCRSGCCSTCTAKILEGDVDQNDQSFLDDDQMNAGYALLCVSYHKSDLVLKGDAEEDLY